MLIYRLQNADGRGPYTSEHIHKGELVECHSGCSKHPTCRCEDLYKYVTNGCIDDGNYWLCGFSSRKKLDEWFSGWLDLLGQVGFSVTRYKVSHIRADLFSLYYNEKNWGCKDEAVRFNTRIGVRNKILELSKFYTGSGEKLKMSIVEVESRLVQLEFKWD